jgi:hypothetical protein
MVVTTRNATLAAVDAPSKISEPVRIAQIGLAGGIGYSHINEYSRNPNLQLVAAYDLYPHEPKVASAVDRIKGMGGKVRLVPVLPVVRSAVERYLAMLP